MANPHRVVQGEHLLSVMEAEKYKGKVATVWTHKNNANLDKTGRTPWILMPDDAVFLPPINELVEPGRISQINTFNAKMQPLQLRVKLLTIKGEGVKISSGLLKIVEDNLTHTLTSSETGIYSSPKEKPLTPKAKTATAQIKMKVGTDGEIERELRFLIGHLHPQTERSGQMQRLNNLGYRAGLVIPDKKTALTDVQKRAFNSAVEEFECDNHLTLTGVRPDGTLHTATIGKLKEVHGC